MIISCYVGIFISQSNVALMLGDAVAPVATKVSRQDPNKIELYFLFLLTSLHHNCALGRTRVRVALSVWRRTEDVNVALGWKSYTTVSCDVFHVLLTLCGGVTTGR